MKKPFAINPAYLIWIGLLVAFLAYNWLRPEQPEITPTQKNGIDTVYAGDSTYVIKFQIDTVFESGPVYEDYDNRN